MRGARAANRPTSLGATVLIVEADKQPVVIQGRIRKARGTLPVARKLRIRLTATDRTRAEEGDT